MAASTPRRERMIVNFLLAPAMSMTPSPGEPGLRPGLSPEQITPGTLGFLFTLFVAVATIFLIRDMSRRIRRVRYRAEVEDGRRTSEDGPAGPDNPGQRPGI